MSDHGLFFTLFYKNYFSTSSSRAQSCDSIPSSEVSTHHSRSVTRNSPKVGNRLIDINSANVFELMTVNGLNQELAANIVEYRERKGSFKAVEELSKVCGLYFEFSIIYRINVDSDRKTS